MAGFDDPAFYGDRWAGVYDEHHAGMDPAPAVEFLAGLAGDGLVLELAIGTGRAALPLAGRGIAVEGIDASEAMVARLRAKPGGESIPVVIGDMAQVSASGPFRLVYLVFNALFGLLSQAQQAECFRNVTRVLDPGGVFVIECFVPDLARFDRGQRVQTRAVTEDADLISGPLAHLPSGDFNASAAWVALAGLSHNLLRATGCLAGAFHAKARGATLRRHLICIPARAARHGHRHLTLHLPGHWRWRPAWMNAFSAVHDPPPARTA